MVGQRYEGLRRWTAAVLALWIALAGIGIHGAFADSVTEDGLKYIVMHGETTITGFDFGTRKRLEARLAAEAGNPAAKDETAPGMKNKKTAPAVFDIVIPERIGEYPVTTIAKWAFQSGRPHIGSVTIPASVKRIGRAAFKDCTAMTALTFSERTEAIEIGAEAFSGCTALKEAVIPEGVTAVENGVFAGCEKLRKVKIAKSVTRIGDSAFEGTAVRTVSLPRKLTDIGKRAFAGTGIKQVILYENLRKIGEEAFPENAQLLIKSDNPQAERLAAGRYDYIIYTSANKQAVINKFAARAELIAVPDKIAGYPIVGFDAGAFENEKKPAPDLAGTSALLLSEAGYPVYSAAYPDMALEVRKPAEDAETEILLVRYDGEAQAVSVPYGVEGILKGAFDGKGMIKAVRIPETVEWIEKGALTGLTGVENVYLSDGLETIPRGELPKSAFCWCDEESETVCVAAASGYTVGGTDMVFEGASDGEGVRLIRYLGNRREVDIPDFVTEIGEGVFRLQQRLRTVKMGNQVKKIGKDAFRDCPKLEIVLPGKSLEEIGDGAFAGCRKLEDIYLPDTTVKIGAEAFWGCGKLKWLAVPASVTEIGDKAFPEEEKEDGVGKDEKESYEGLTLLAADGSAAQVYAEAHELPWLALNPEGRTITLPAGTREIGEEAFRGVAAWEITVPEECETIGDRAFAGSGARIAVIPATVEAIGKDAFDGAGIVILCEYKSFAEAWCEEHGMIHVLSGPGESLYAEETATQEEPEESGKKAPEEQPGYAA